MGAKSAKQVTERLSSRARRAACPGVPARRMNATLTDLAPSFSSSAAPTAPEAGSTALLGRPQPCGGFPLVDAIACIMRIGSVRRKFQVAIHLLNRLQISVGVTQQ